MKKVTYNVPSRIAINLYDMNGNLGRVDGGMGFSLEYPRLVFQAERAKKFLIESSAKISEEMTTSIKSALKNLRKRFGLEGMKLFITENIPEHSGLGSKTATLLSIGHAYGNLYGYNFDFRGLAVHLKRGGTSGLGINLINKGGFLLEGGHSTDMKEGFLPSSHVNHISPSPILARYEMPNWEVFLILPHTERIHGKKELEVFQNICPVPQEDVERVARVTLSKILPAVVEADIESFCEGINLVQESTWKKGEISLYGDFIRGIRDYLLSRGIAGVGMSSMGPCLYAFGHNLESIANSLDMSRFGKLEFVKLTKPNNNGIRIKELR